MAKWLEHSIGVAPQTSGFGTPNVTDADFRYLQVDKPKVTFTSKVTELALTTGRIGAAPERIPGIRSGTVTILVPGEAFKALYAPATENPGDTGVVPFWLALIGNVLGSQNALATTAAEFWKGKHLSNSEYTAGGVASATSTSVTVDDSTASDKVLGGELVVTALSPTSTSLQIGYVKTKLAQLLTLFEASANTVNDAAAHVFGTSTAWLSVALLNQIPCTMRWKGENTAFCYILKDCVCTGFKLKWDAGEVPSVELMYKFFDFNIDTTLGGLEIPTYFTRLPQIIGSANGRVMLNGSTKCGLAGCELEFKVDVKEIVCHSAAQGVGGVALLKPRISAKFSVLHDSADAVYDATGTGASAGQHIWQSWFERQTPFSIGCYVGSQVGRVFAFLIPAARLTASPTVEDRDGELAWGLQVEAGLYTADTSDTAETSANSPLDSVFRLSLG